MLPYYQIPKAPETFTAASVMARAVDGLGYRYYWATEKLTEENLKYKPSEEGRSIGETLDHIYSLVYSVVNTITAASADIPLYEDGLSFEDKRKRSLLALKVSSDFLRANPDIDFENRKVIFRSLDRQTDFPFWNIINGPIEDALWHTGQVVMMRRSAGNPLPAGVNVFLGKTN